MILTNYLIGFIEDNAGLFSLPRLISGLKGCTDFVGYPTGLCQNLLASNQPLIFIPAFLLAKLVDSVLAYNLIVLGGTALNFFFAFRFFKKLFGRSIAVLLVSILLTSPFLAYQSRSHFDLLQFWSVIWFLDTLFFSQSRYKAVFLGLLLTLIMGISNYLGYFTILFTACYLIFSFLTRPDKILSLRLNCSRVIKSAMVFTLTSLFFMAPYIEANFFTPRIRVEENINDKAINRPFEDFITFSSRPWYYLLPSIDNPFFGGLSHDVLDRLASGGNYLTQNYFKAEHSASYLGWVNLSLALVGLVGSGMLCRSTKHPTNIINYLAILLTIVGLIILTMPPAMIVNEVTIYTPSYLLFKIFPMFRVLARAGVLILFLTLIFTGYGYLAVVNLAIAKKIPRRLVQSTLLFLALVSVAEFFIPLKITHVGIPPKVYAYIGATDPLKSPMVIYPYNKTNEAFFWLTVHKQPLINPRFYEDRKTGFVSEDFTNLLNTVRGLEKARNMGAKYLVYFYTDDAGESADFFATSPLLTRVEEFKEGDQEKQRVIVSRIIPPTNAFLRIVEAGSTVSNSAILYKFR
ncbi:hypothetical protein COT50_01570 [candidate division WWE3 bacterium CG08_land_8_20_14_0_20_41_10]|uniref:Glycosyltransferase RgtA/B/C/D-like domain-containing protein n=1 Tax=candidate division WWE3 bacterium CG08_land_8_20_14_0_20_41_10 TaxID=1975085 RepID=A0A2H0XC86_UNCKA|nr:MAG: hypothetical protein COT50_01570 [candidate division WWE3 bacterium CG08_land_8_20_14_0_20_41_10]